MYSFTGGLGCSGLFHLLYLKRVLLITIGVPLIAIIYSGNSAGPGYHANAEERLGRIEKIAEKTGDTKIAYDVFYAVFCGIYYDCCNKAGNLSDTQIIRQIERIRAECGECQDLTVEQVRSSEEMKYTIAVMYVREQMTKHPYRTPKDREALWKLMRPDFTYECESSIELVPALEVRPVASKASKK